MPFVSGSEWLPLKNAVYSTTPKSRNKTSSESWRMKIFLLGSSFLELRVSRYSLYNGHAQIIVKNDGKMVQQIFTMYLSRRLPVTKPTY